MSHYLDGSNYINGKKFKWPFLHSPLEGSVPLRVLLREAQGDFISRVIDSCFPCFVSGGSFMLWNMNYRSVAETSQLLTCISYHPVKLNNFCWTFSSLNRVEDVG
jgi:hypothetical protein